MHTTFLAGKPERNRRCGRPRETGCESVNWMHLAQDRDHGNEPLDSIKDGEFLE
jgi:hypothetical protein